MAVCASGVDAVGRGWYTPQRPSSISGRGRQMTVPTSGRDPQRVNTLLLQVADGNHEAYAQLYDAVAPVAFGISRRVLRDHAQSEEVTQEVMLEVWRQAAKFDPLRGNATAWVATIAHRRAVDRVRASESSRQREKAAGGWDVPHDSVAEHVEETDERQNVAWAMSQLTPLQREAIQLAYYDGRTYREVANHLHAPLGTIKTRMRDGLQRLRQALDSPDEGTASTGAQR